MTQEEIRELDMLVPNMPLILYAKNWIRFKDRGGAYHLMSDMCDVVEMCGYNAVHRNPVIQVVMLYDGIVKYFDELSQKYPNLKIKPTRRMTSIYHFMAGVFDQYLISKGIGHHSCFTELAFSEAVVNTILSELMNLKICPPMKMRRIEFDKKSNIIMGGAGQTNGRTYKQMQRDFDKTFGGCFLSSTKKKLQEETKKKEEMRRQKMSQ